MLRRVLARHQRPRCTEEEPELVEAATGGNAGPDGGASHQVACHLHEQLSLRAVAD